MAQLKIFAEQTTDPLPQDSVMSLSISEKVWKALLGNTVPIVRGPSPDDYKRQLPPNSFIHVDSFSDPKDLISHVKFLTENDKAYG